MYTRRTIITMLALAPVSAYGHWDPRYAQAADPATRDWFGKQKVPDENGNPGTAFSPSCCSSADGVYAEEDIRGDDVWTRFVATWYTSNAQTLTWDVPWMVVPKRVIIPPPYDPRIGQPVVWWSGEWENARNPTLKTHPDGSPVVSIRCYKPGVRV